MEIELPDGTVLDAPDDADPSVVAKAYLKNQSRQQVVASNPGEYDPNSPEWQAKYGATSGMSRMDKFMAGAGKSVADMGRGIKQLAGLGSREQQDEVNRLDAPLMATGEGIAGNIAGTVASIVAPGGVIGKAGQIATKAPQLATAGRALSSAGQALANPQSIRAAMAAGAAVGAAQPVGTDGSRTMNTIFGGLTGGVSQGIVKGIGAIAQPVKRALSAIDEKAVQTLEKAGVALDTAQKSGSQRAMQVKRFLADNPVTAGGQVKQAEKTLSTFTKATLKEIGESADTADEEVLGRASKRIGKVFNDVAERNQIKADDRLLDQLADISKQAPAELEASQAQVILNQVDEILDKASSGAINGKAYQNIKSTLDRISGGPNQQVGFWARAVRERLDEALQRSAQGNDYAALKEARKQYGALEKIVSAVNPDGYVSPSKLYNATNVKAFGQKKAMATGIRQTELQKLAKAGKRIIPERMPNSGTTPRALLQAALPAAAGGAYGFSQDANLGDAAKYAALGVGAPFLAQKLMNNPSAVQYMTKGLQGPARGLLLSGPQTLPGAALRQAPLAGLLSLQAEQ